MITITFNPRQMNEKFLSELPKRSRDIIIHRYGLGNNAKRSTLDAIGQKYGITRERVRQIENHSLRNIQKSNLFNEKGTVAVFDELAGLIQSLGGVAAESDLLNFLSKDKRAQNHFLLLLILGKPFIKEKEDSEFKNRWSTDKKLSDNILSLLKDLHKEFTGDELVSEEEIISLMRKKNQNRFKGGEDAKRWLSLSKIIGKNPFNEWGLSQSPNVKVKGIRSYAYLVVRQNGSPMHFVEVAKMIQKHFNRKVHTATCHNELIKDKRFVLVGRGLYALAEWGYTRGVVREVIKDILKSKGSLSKEEITKRVLKERYVKSNTVAVNLQNPDYFKRNKDGTYSIS